MTHEPFGEIDQVTVLQNTGVGIGESLPINTTL